MQLDCDETDILSDFASHFEECHIVTKTYKMYSQSAGSKWTWEELPWVIVLLSLCLVMVF